jgi:hypothetical protein
MLEWTAVVAFLVALLARSNGQATWSFDFAQLPADDSALVRWLERRGHRDVRVLRDGLTIKFESQQSAWVFTDPSFASQLPRPPWTELGYIVPHAMRGTSNWTFLSGSPYLWIVGFGILLLLGHFRRRRARIRS